SPGAKVTGTMVGAGEEGSVIESGCTLLPDGSQPFGRVAAQETEELVGERGVEGRVGRSQPVVEGVFRPRQGLLRAGRQPVAHLSGGAEELGVVDYSCDQAHSLSRFAVDRVVGEE